MTFKFNYVIQIKSTIDYISLLSLSLSIVTKDVNVPFRVSDYVYMLKIYNIDKIFPSGALIFPRGALGSYASDHNFEVKTVLRKVIVYLRMYVATT